MSDTDQKFEKILIGLNLPGPRVTLAMVDEILRTVTYETSLVKGTTCMQAVAILPSGFVLATGQSNCADPADFNPALGIEMAISKARDLARDAIWKHENYRLKQALYEVRHNKASAALSQIRSVLGAKDLPERLVGPEQVKALQASEGRAPHEIRVIHEKAELDDKIASLYRFFDADTFKSLPIDERQRLVLQQVAMSAYSRVLGERIEAFRPAPGSQDAGASQ